MTLGDRSKPTRWDLEASLVARHHAQSQDKEWWDQADAMEELIGILYSTCQWWKGKGQPPMDGISQWMSCWGLVPKDFDEWLAFVGLDLTQINHLLSQLGQTCVNIITPQWIRRCKEVATKQGQTSSAAPSTQTAEAATVRPLTRKRKLDAITRGTAIPTSRQLGLNNWWSNSETVSYRSGNRSTDGNTCFIICDLNLRVRAHNVPHCQHFCDRDGCCVSSVGIYSITPADTVWPFTAYFVLQGLHCTGGQ